MNAMLTAVNAGATSSGEETTTSTTTTSATVHLQPGLPSDSPSLDEEQKIKSTLSKILINKNGLPVTKDVSPTRKSTPQTSNIDSQDSKSTDSYDSLDENKPNEDNDLGEYKETVLLPWSDMPRHLQFNPYIYTGYRPLMNAWGCITSLFYVHNETVNILTHGLPIVYILVTVPSLLPWGSQGPLAAFLSWCHLIGAVSPWIGSFLYHLFMNLDKGEAIYKKLLQLDMLGIWISQSFGALPMIAASVHCLPETLCHCCILIYSVLSFWGLLKAMNAWSPWERRLCFAPPFMMRMFVLTLRYFGVSGGSPTALTHLVLQDLVAVAGGAVGALHVPEKWFPGKVDLFLNSHNIMHVMVVMAVYSMHAATLRDLSWMSNPAVCIAVPIATLSSTHEEL